jgi:hypothetical protein
MIMRLLQVPGPAAVSAATNACDFTGPFVFPCHVLEYEDMPLTGQCNVL